MANVRFSKCQIASRFALGTCFACSAFTLNAAEWDTGAALSASAYVTDNFCLSPTDKEQETVYTLTPRVNLNGRGARADMLLNARLELNSLAQSDIECGAGLGRNRESLIPSGTFRGNVEAIENWLTFNADASARLTPVNPFSPGSGDVVNGRGNTNIVYRVGAGATIAREFERKVGLNLRYNYNEQFNSFDTLYGNSQEDRVTASFGMLPGASRFLLSTRGSYSEVSFDATPFNPAFTNTLASAEVRATFNISDSWNLSAAVGEEFNEFLSVSDEIDGEYWDAGIQWTPNSRVNVDVGYGKRFFGSTPRALISYRHKRSSFQASYTRSLTFPRNLRNPQTDVVGGVTDPNFGDLLGDPISGNDAPVLVGDSPILVEAFGLQYNFSARRTRFNVSARDSRQTRASDLSSGVFRNVSTSVSRTISPQLSLSLRLSWRESEGEGGVAGLFGQNSQTYSGDVSLSRRVAQNTSVSLGYRYTDQRSDFALNEFEENRLTLTLSHNFR